MNRDEIIRMAREAGFESSEYGLNCTPGMYAYNMEVVDRFAALVAAAEREACARVADNQAQDEPYGHAKFRCVNIAAAIRARGKE